MAIAGSALNSAIAYLKPDGTLYLGLFVMRGSDIVEQDMQRAIERIRNGERLAVWVHGNNVYMLRNAFPSPRPLEAAGWTSDCE